MKKLLLLTITLFTLGANAQTSVYHPFPDSAAVWNVSRTSGLLECTYSPPVPYHETFSYIFSGDTVINSVAYHKLFVPFVQRTDSCNMYEWHTSPGYAGCIRQNSIAKKVFFIPRDSSSEYILYDFTLQPGDAVPLPPTVGCGNLLDTIQSVDSVLIGSDYRKQWNLKYSGGLTDYTYIEGIGYTSGLITPCSYPDGDTWELACFQQNGSIIYHPDGTVPCDIIISVKDIQHATASVSISPNPFHASAVLTITEEDMKGENIYLSIYDVTGRELLQQAITSQATTLNCNLLTVGIYFYRLQGSKRRNSKREICN